jgi:hypothetical protein
MKEDDESSLDDAADWRPAVRFSLEGEKRRTASPLSPSSFPLDHIHSTTAGSRNKGGSHLEYEWKM